MKPLVMFDRFEVGERARSEGSSAAELRAHFCEPFSRGVATRARVVVTTIDRGQFLRRRLVDADALRFDVPRRLEQRLPVLSGRGVDAL